MKFKNIPRAISYLRWRWTATTQLDRLWASKDYQPLILLCDSMLEKNPNDFLAFYYRGLAKEMVNLFSESIEDFKKSENLLTSNKRKSLVKDYFTKIPIQISRVYRKLQDKEKVFEYADRAVQADGLEIDGLKWRASLKEDYGDLIGASEDLNEAIKKKTDRQDISKIARQADIYNNCGQERNGQPLTKCICHGRG